jgi:uncharacterized membrane protein
MIRQPFIEHDRLIDGDFRVRGPEVSRIEGFSDAAFAFAITLLVVSLEVPRDFDQLLDVLKGIPSFAVCFAILVWLWVAHYKFFRRYGLEDRLTIALNSVLLFVVMVYVYPLKFVFTIFMGMLTGIQPRNTGKIDVNQVGELFVIYGIGFFAVFVILALMNLRAYALRDKLELNELERLLTRAEVARCLGVASIGLLSVAVAMILRGGVAGLAGLAYFLIGLVEFLVGWYYGNQRDVLVSQRGAGVEDDPARSCSV